MPGQAHQAADAVERVEEEAGVLEDPERGEVDAQRQHEAELAVARIGRAGDGAAGEEVVDRRQPEQRQEAPVPPGVEEVRGERQPGEAPQRAAQRPPADQHDRQEDEQEDEAREQHGR